MIALLSFLLTLFASLFKSKSRLEAENAVLRHQLTVLQRLVLGRAHFTPSLHDPPPVPSSHLTRCLWNRQQPRVAVFPTKMLAHRDRTGWLAW
jgi:hypothetical protein